MCLLYARVRVTQLTPVFIPCTRIRYTAGACAYSTHSCRIWLLHARVYVANLTHGLGHSHVSIRQSTYMCFFHVRVDVVHAKVRARVSFFHARAYTCIHSYEAYVFISCEQFAQCVCISMHVPLSTLDLVVCLSGAACAAFMRVYTGYMQRCHARVCIPGTCTHMRVLFFPHA